MAFLIRIVVIAISLWVATLLVPGIDNTAGTTGARIGTLIGVALVFGLVNAVLKPIIKVVGCPLYLFIASGLGLPFRVDGFGPAFVGAIVVAVVGFVLHFAVPDRLDRR